MITPRKKSRISRILEILKRKMGLFVVRPQRHRRRPYGPGIDGICPWQCPEARGVALGGPGVAYATWYDLSISIEMQNEHQTLLEGPSETRSIISRFLVGF